MSLECLSKRNGVRPPFRFRGDVSGRQAFVLLVFGENETKRVFLQVSLGNPRASPPRIRLKTGGTRSISMGYVSHEIDPRQFFLQTGHHLHPHKSVQTGTALSATRRSSYPFYSSSLGICLAFRCLTEKCPAGTNGVDTYAMRQPATGIINFESATSFDESELIKLASVLRYYSHCTI